MVPVELFYTQKFSSPEAAILLVSTKSETHDLWPESWRFFLKYDWLVKQRKDKRQEKTNTLRKLQNIGSSQRSILGTGQKTASSILSIPVTKHFVPRLTRDPWRGRQIVFTFPPSLAGRDSFKSVTSCLRVGHDVNSGWMITLEISYSSPSFFLSWAPVIIKKDIGATWSQNLAGGKSRVLNKSFCFKSF